MPIKIRLTPSPTPGLKTNGITSLALLAGATWYPVDHEDASMSRGLEVSRGQAPKRSAGVFRGARRTGGYNDGTRNRSLINGFFEYETDVAGPGAGGSWLDRAIWHVFASRFRDQGAPLIASDSVVSAGASKKRLTPTTPLSWRVGDMAMLTINGEPHAFRVTGRHAGGDIFIQPGLPAAISATTAYLCRVLFYDPKTPGPELVAEYHTTDHLWIATIARMAGFSLRRSMDDGRILLKPKIEVGQWYADHASANPYCTTGDCACTPGPDQILSGVVPAISSDFCGIGGTLNAPPWNADRFTTDPIAMGVEAAFAPKTQLRKSMAQRVNARDIKAGDADFTLSLPMCDIFALLDEDMNKNARRSWILPTGPVGQTQGFMVWMGAMMVDDEPRNIAQGEVVDEQTLKVTLDEYCGDQITPPAPYDALVTTGVNRALAVGFVV